MAGILPEQHRLLHSLGWLFSSIGSVLYRVPGFLGIQPTAATSFQNLSIIFQGLYLFIKN